MDNPSFQAVIDLWPTRSALQRDLREHGGADQDAPVYQWHHEDRIPEKWFDALLKAAAHRGFVEVTYPVLSRLYRERAERAPT